MLKAPLPKQVDIRKLANKNAEFSVEFTPEQTTRFAAVLANTEGLIACEMQLYVDEQYRRRVDGNIKAKVNAVCQRCLGGVEVELTSTFSLAVVWNDEQAKVLPKDIDPLILDEDELVDLVDIVEEELLLSLPYVNYHEDMNCVAALNADIKLDEQSATDQSDTAEEFKKPNPFDVLAQLKTDKPDSAS